MIMSTARRCLLCKRGDRPFELAAHRGESATGEKNFRYVIEGSEDLVRWMKLAVRTNITGVVEFTDVNARCRC